MNESAPTLDELLKAIDAGAVVLEIEAELSSDALDSDFAQRLRWLASHLPEMLAENVRLRAALESIRDGYDHDMQTHQHQPFKYGGGCRVCMAQAALEPSTDATAPPQEPLVANPTPDPRT
jgi:hypothetical protein